MMKLMIAQLKLTVADEPDGGRPGRPDPAGLSAMAFYRAHIPRGLREAAEARLADLRAMPKGLTPIEKIARMMQRSEYKRSQASQPIRLRARAFGQGRRMPIAAVFPGALA